MSVTAFAPISTGNFIIGFDMLGAAMRPVHGTPLGDWVQVSEAKNDVLSISGPYRSQLPAQPEQNIVWACLNRFNNSLQQRGVSPKTLHLHLYKALPVGSGLGSSAASVVASIKALNLFYDEALDQRELLALCGELEGTISGSVHYDNVGPSLLGGLQLMNDGDSLSERLPTPPWFYVLLHPGTQLATKDARAVLPQNVPLTQTVHMAMRVANFVHALHQHKYGRAAALLHDNLIEPHRATLIPAFKAAQQAALAAGALAYSISGAGPTCIAVCPDIAIAERVEKRLLELYTHSAVQSWVCTLDDGGARRAELPSDA